MTASYVSKFCGTKCRERVRYENNRESRMQLSRDYRAKNREEILAKRRARYQERRVEMREQNRRSYLKHREVRVANAIAYQKENPQVVALTRAKRRAAKSFKINQRDHRSLLARYRNCCAYCNVKLAAWGRESENSLQWDHIVPLSKGGDDSVGNILPVCRGCNYNKSAKFLYEWKLGRELSRIEAQK